ncbi:pentatricopeptide repeat-containing protein mitochondrial-like [Hordeum vulgare]|nr:pentatricopeptide repeat-containing protein mitochondrial-like [Hordeum vulgare]
MLKGYLKTGDYAAFDLLIKEVTGGKRRLKPNVTTYKRRMSGLCAKGRSFEAEELLEAMAANGVKHAKELGMAMKNSAKGDAKEEWEKVEADAFQLALAEMKA